MGHRRDKIRKVIVGHESLPPLQSTHTDTIMMLTGIPSPVLHSTCTVL